MSELAEERVPRDMDDEEIKPDVHLDGHVDHGDEALQGALAEFGLRALTGLAGSLVKSMDGHLEVAAALDVS